MKQVHVELVLGVCARMALVGCETRGPSEPTAQAPLTRTTITLQGDQGDYVSGGASFRYTQASALIAGSAEGGLLTVSVTGDEQWVGRFAMPAAKTALEPGMYADLERYPIHSPLRGGLDWSGEGRGCNTLTGWFAIDSVTYTAGALQAVAVRFEQHCGESAAGLRGSIQWAMADTTSPPGPITPVPPTLWRPPSTAPQAGNFVYLQSDVGDPFGNGQSTAAAAPAPTVEGGRLSISVLGYRGVFQAMNSVTTLREGYYPGLRRYPFHNPAKGGLSWSGEGVGCNTLSGWFAIDQITILSGTLTSVQLRFEQHCGGREAALHGVYHWAVQQ